MTFRMPIQNDDLEFWSKMKVLEFCSKMMIQNANWTNSRKMMMIQT